MLAELLEDTEDLLLELKMPLKKFLAIYTPNKTNLLVLALGREVTGLRENKSLIQKIRGVPRVGWGAKRKQLHRARQSGPASWPRDPDSGKPNCLRLLGQGNVPSLL